VRGCSRASTVSRSSGNALAQQGGDAGARVRLLSSGERATVRGWLEPLTDFDSRWRWRHAVATLHMTELLAVGGARAPLDRIANAGRDAVLRGSQHIEPTDRALLAGFLLGDTRGVPEDVTDQFRLAGLTHLTAVSGGNVAFVLALCAPALRRLRLSGRLAAGMAVLVVFGTMTRWEPSVVRAIAMALIGLVAGYLGRPTSGVRALALAAIVLLAIDPFLLHSVGFLLSCGASLGITLLAAPITRRLRGPAWAREVLGVTAAAQVGVAPILIPVFGSMPLVSLPANLVAVPLAAPLTIWSLATGLAGGLVQPVLPQVTSLLTLPTTALLHALRAIAAVASRVPVTIDGRGAWAAIAVGSLIAAAVRSRSLRRDERSDREPGIPASSGAGPERPGARERASGNRVSR
jgi:competence protein ComEC